MAVVEKVKPLREIISKKGGETELRLNFHEGQVRAMKSEARIIAMLSGTQGGKTEFGPHWLLEEIKATVREGETNDYLAITATYPLLNLKMLTAFRNLFEYLMDLGEYKESSKVFISNERYHGTELWRVIFGSATNPESIESATAKAAWLDEAGQKQFRRGAWDAVLRRLGIYRGRVLITTTLYGLGWLKTEVYDKALAGDKDIELIQFDSTMNPAYSKEEFEERRKSVPDWKFNMFWRGRYATPPGLIYDAFNEPVCLIKRFDIPKDWARYVGHDFGGVNTVALWIAQDPGTGYRYVYREYHEGGKSAAEHAEKWMELSKGERIVKRVGGAPSEDNWRTEFAHTGWQISKPLVKDVEVGIDKVYALHKANKYFVFDDLLEYLDEKRSYSRKLDEDNNFKMLEEIENKSAYHLMDSERYLISDFASEVPFAKPGERDKILLRRY